MVRERVTLRPGASIAETAGRVVTGLTRAGNILLDLAAAESTVIVQGLKDGVPLGHSTSALADLIPLAMGTIIDSQKRFLDAIAEQSQELVEAYTEGEPLTLGTRLTKMGRERLECFVDAQKKLLDQVADQVTIATEPGKEGKAADRSKVMIQLVRESIGKFIDTQKQLLDLTIKQMEAGSRGHVKPAPHTSLAELTQKSVRNFTTAQKSLLDIAVKPVLVPKAARKAPAAPRRAAKPRKRPAAADADK
jgi:hypothetical protein